MNLRQMVSMARTLVGTDSGKMPDPEAIEYMNVAQQVTARSLVNIDRDLMTKTATITAVSGTASYQLPFDVDDLVRVSYAGADCSRLGTSDVGATLSNRLYEGHKGFSQFYYLFQAEDALTGLGGAGRRPMLGLVPVPDDTTAITLWYVMRSKRFDVRGIYDGTVAATGGSATTIADPNIPYAGAAAKVGLDDFWNGAEIEFNSGNVDGYRRIATDFAEDNGGVFGQVTFAALPEAPATGVTFMLDQVSILPEYAHDIVVYEAAHLMALKLGKDPTVHVSQFNDGVAGIARRWVQNVEPPIAKLGGS